MTSAGWAAELGGYQEVRDATNTALPVRKVLKVFGAVSIVDDPVNGWTILEVATDTYSKSVNDVIAAVGTYNGQVVQSSCRAVEGDGGGGPLIWIADSSATPDGGYIFQVGSNPGRWIRGDYDGRTFNARYFAARGDGSVNDDEAIQAAFDAVPSSGGEVVIPSGLYVNTDTLLPKSNTTITGSAGTVFIRSTTSGGAVIYCNFVERVRITGCNFFHEAYDNFIKQVQIENSTECEVDHCTFDAEWSGSTPGVDMPEPGDTLHGILSRQNRGLRVCDNRSRYFQFKLEGALGGGESIVQRNYFEDPYNFAVSFVVSDELTEGVIENILCDTNLVKNPLSNGGFHVGGDGTGAELPLMRNVTISNNQVFGDVGVGWDLGTGVNNVSFSVRLGILSTDVRILNNTSRNAVATLEGNTWGIRVTPSDTVAGEVSGLYVEGNTIEGAGLYGIDVQCSGKAVWVCRNTVSRSRGIHITSNGGDLSGVKIAWNHSSSLTYGIHCHALDGDLTDVMVCNNTCADGEDTGIRMEAASTFTIEGSCSSNRCYGASQEFGIDQRGAGSFLVYYRDNDCTGSATTGLKLTNGLMYGSDNIGPGSSFKSSNFGIATLGNPATSVTIAHGLKAVTTATIQVVGLALVKPNSGAAHLTLTAHTIDANNFVVATSAATAEAGYTVHWEIQAAEFA